MKKVIRIKNLDCAACAAELSEELEALEGISEAHADFINQRVSLEYESDAALGLAVDVISHFEEVEIVEAGLSVKRERHLKELLSIAISAAFFVPALILEIVGVGKWVSFAFFLASFAAAGWGVLWNVVLSVPRAFKNGFHPSVLLDENMLMTVAAIGAIAIGETMEAAAVMLLYQIGELLQSVAVGSSRGAITRLLALKSSSAILIEGDNQREVAPEELEVGSLILLRKGDKVPVDCRLTEGATSLDTKSLTGEAYLKEVAAGDEMLEGCVNEGNAVRAEVIRPASESAVAKILDMVENSSAKKAKPEKFITRFARIYTPIVVLFAVLIAVVPPLFQNFDFVKWLTPAIEFLVISCPCALIISVPLTYFAGVGNLAREGVLTKGAVGLDLLARVKTAAFDKTGTLTEGRFTIGDVKGGDHVLNLAAASEKLSSHPLAQAFADMVCPSADSCEEIAGMGIASVVNGKHVLVGSHRLMETYGVACEEETGSDLTIYVAEEGTYLGYVKICDKLREEAADALWEMKRAGVRHIAVLTGDSEERARAVLRELPVDELHAGLLPAEKPVRAQALKSYGPLLYVGDGINDTPVMAEADVSVAMGGLGSDAAIEASDFVLVSDRLTALPKAFRGAQKTRRIVTENIVCSIAVKVALMAVSLVATATALFSLPIWAAVFGDVGVMLLAVLNALRMRRKLK